MHLDVFVRATIVAGAIACATLLAMPARADQPPPTLSLTGTGELAVAPDMAAVSSGVVTEAKTAREALDANNEAIAAVIAALKEAGIEPADIRTAGFSVEPVFRQRDKQQPDDEAPRIVGYRVANSVQVTVRDLDRLGAVLDKSVTVGANRISGIQFIVSDADRRLDEARTVAMQDAIRKAGIYAAAAGVRLVRILSINESGGFRPMPKDAFVAMRADMAPAVPVEAGEQRISVDVNVTWEIGD